MKQETTVEEASDPTIDASKTEETHKIRRLGDSEDKKGRECVWGGRQVDIKAT